MADDTDRILNTYGPQDDEHGFLFSRVGGDLKFNPYEAIKKFMAYRAPPGALSSSGDDTAVRSAADVAGWVGMSGLGLNAFGAVPANALGSAGAKAPQALRATAPPRVENPIRAYHGSPHDFDKFDLSKIGTGEGAQAYGHGLYFAESPEVASSYRQALTGNHAGDMAAFNVDGQRIASPSPTLKNIMTQGYAAQPERWAERLLPRIEDAKRMASSSDELEAMIGAGDLKRLQGIYDEAMGYAGKSLTQSAPGRTYEVAIHATPEQFLDWDRPLSQQSEAVRKATDAILAEKAGKDITPEFYGSFGTSGQGIHNLLSAWSKHKPDTVAQSLKERGVAGIEYLDQGSRTAPLAAGTKNRVVFDPERIEILRKYGLLGPVAGLSTAEILQRYGQDERE